MRIVLDLQGAQAESRFRGIGRYSLSLALAIARQRAEHEVVVALSGLFPDTIEPLRGAFDGVLPQDNIRVWQAPEPLAYIDAENRKRRHAAELIREAFLATLQPDVVHVASLFEGYGDSAIASIGRFTDKFRTAVTLYDLIPFSHAFQYQSGPNERDWYNDRFNQLRRADLLLAISEASRQEGIAHRAARPEQIVTISAAVDSSFKPVSLEPAAKAELLRRHGIQRPFVMYTGGDQDRKNMEGLIRAYARLPLADRQDRQLVIACSLSAHRRQMLQALATEHELSPEEVVLTGRVPDADLIGLYNLCELFVFPSWYEGFGLPALEAMSCGAPVIGSNTTSVPEVIGRADALFDPYSDESIAAKMHEVLSSPEFRTDLAQHGLQRATAFTWDESGRRAIAGFEQLHAPREPIQPAAAPRRPRLAFVSPLPPERSGIADYSAELLPALAQHYEIELIASDAHRNEQAGPAGLPIRSAKWLRQNTEGFDRALYQFGNSPFHEFMLDLLVDVPGVVVLHDFFLGDLMADREHTRRQTRGWTHALYESHGYGAVRERFHAKKESDVSYKYPVNLELIRRAQGVIVHSEFSRWLAQDWYGKDVGEDWLVLPFSRAFQSEVDRSSARAALGLAPDDFLVCCFGLLGETKLNHRTLAGWLSSALAADERCRLVFVGEMDPRTYGRLMRRAIEESGLSRRIEITGWADQALFRRYLAAADVAVQLRAQSRGETSGTVLDCMNFGLPTIVTACGAMAELPTDAVWMLPEHLTDAQLTTALETLRQDNGRRATLGARAREVIRTQHDPQSCAVAYADAIERFHERAQTGVPALIEAIAAANAIPDDVEAKQVARAIAANHPRLRSAKRLFVDVSELARRDAGTGIQRVVRSVLQVLLSDPPERFRIEPVYATATSDGYRFARRFTLAMNGCPQDRLDDEVIDPSAGDVFLGLDLEQSVTAAQSARLAAYRAAGVRVYHVIYDLLPVLRPDCYLEEKTDAHARWLDTIARLDGVITISRAVADEFSVWLDAHGPERHRPLQIGWWHLGADIGSSAPTRGLASGAAELLARLRAAPTFLVVGTIEPRKGLAQTLSAFELLWSSGLDGNLVLVGKQGWMVDDFVKRIRAHAELNKRLIWLEAISDEYLEQLYAAATCLLAPSEGEGFGLPLIEAARHKLPVIARDIPVFREVAGDHAFYFVGKAPSALAEAVRDWLTLFKSGRVPRSEGMPWLTWKESTSNLMRLILQDEWLMAWPRHRVEQPAEPDEPAVFAAS